MPSQENPSIEQKQILGEQIAFASGLFQGDVTIRTLLESLAEGVVVVGKSGTILVLNTRSEQMFGYSKQELIGMPHSILIPERFRMAHEKHEASFFAEPMIRPMDHLFYFAGRRKDGSEFPLEVSLGYIETINGPLTLALVSDITLRKQYEMRLREKEELFRIQVECVKDYAIFMLDINGYVLTWNTGAECLKGYRPEEIIGRHFSSFYPEEERNAGKPAEMLEIAVREGRAKDEGWRVRKDGSRFWADVIITALRDEAGDLRGFSKVTHDITERMRAAEDLARYQENLEETVKERTAQFEQAKSQAETASRDMENLLASSRVATLFLDQQMNIMGFTPALAAIFDLVPSDMGKSFRDFSGKLDWPSLSHDVAMVLGGQPFAEREVDNLEAGRCYLKRVFPYRTQEGEIGGIIVTFIDITARKQVENEKLLLESQLQQAQKLESIGRLAGGVAHDFNNMLTVIAGHVHLILMEIDPAHSLHASIEEIHKATEKSAELTRQLLAFARKQIIAPRIIDLNETVAAILNMLHRLIGEDIELQWQPGQEVWPIKADPSQIDQVLTNLCINSRDAINGVGKITIRTANKSIDELYCAQHAGVMPGDYVLIEVSDDGCGMDNQTLEHIFEPFFTTKGTDAGTGLGLATVYGAVKQNNGFIDVLSNPSLGTMFLIYLPRHTGQDSEQRTEVDAESAPHGHETILVVEDEPAILNIVAMILTKQGYTVLEANTPSEAIRQAKEHAGKIDLLLTDVIMPEMNGIDLSKILLRDSRDLKCLFMSGYTADLVTEHSFQVNESNLLLKPFSGHDLSVKVRESLDSK
jgi:two-component system, cell cycle sensor histidine kinase and response regulator CckA